MSQTTARRFCKTVPGKIFVLGEYAVLAGQPALVATVGPRFELTPADSAFETPSASPSGRLLAHARKQGWKGELRAAFVDPHQGAGGFGASSAQFDLVYSTLAPELGWPTDWRACWELYRALHRDEPLPPSGADVAVQWVGGIARFDPIARECLDLGSRFAELRVLAFSASGIAGRKVPTHEHLARIAGGQAGDPRSDLVAELGYHLGEGLDALEHGDPVRLGEALTGYAHALWRAGLESPATHEDRLALAGIPGVLGIKGCGAMQADAMIALLSQDADTDRVVRAAESRGLLLVSRGLKGEPGLEGA